MRTSKRPNRWLPLVLVVALGACEAGEGAADTALPQDSAVGDTDAADTRGADSTPADSGAGDSALTDSASTDSADAPPLDTAEVDTAPPPAPQILLTVNRIPAGMNGNAPYTTPGGVETTFRLRVNRANFTLDVLPAGGGPVDWGSVQIDCEDDDNASVVLPALQVSAEPARDGASMRFTADSAPTDGVTVHCRAQATGPGGQAESRFSFDAATLPPSLDPFVEVDPWLVVLSRDIFALELSEAEDGSYVVTSNHVPAGNGVSDFDEAFLALGLFSADNTATNAAVKAQLLRSVRRQVNEIYGLDDAGRPTAEGVRVRIYFEGDEGAPDPADFATGDFSMIALGGDGDTADQLQGTFGRALVDWNNQEREDDTVYGLGVFPTSVVRAVLEQPLGLYLFQGIIPTEGGVAIGDGPHDALFAGVEEVDTLSLPDDATRRRAELYQLAIQYGGLALAAVLTHEMGHSLGLVPAGPPPEGLFARVQGPEFLGEDVDGAHVNTAGLNVMQQGRSVNWLSAINDTPRFNPLNWAYLRRQLVVGDLP